MEAATRNPAARGIENDRARGAWLRGSAPRELVLSDGTRLALEPGESGGVAWRRRDELEGRTQQLSTAEARELAGEWSGYVEVRTRAESEWLRTVAQWCESEATRLDGELSTGVRCAGTPPGGGS